MTTLLIDGDILVFQVASACQSTGVDWGGGIYSQPVADLNEAKGRFRDRVAELKQGCAADKVLIALKGRGNFRRDVLATYKANRSTIVPPMLRAPLMDWLLTHPQVVSRPGLEGDDVIGILATRAKDETFIWSTDKDLRQIPGQHLTEDFKIVTVTEAEGDYLHMMQTITGDRVDGYGGCPGIGPKNAEKILGLGRAWWASVVAAYEKAGLTEADALAQARVARILRASDYNFIERKPILWTPPATS